MRNSLLLKYCQSAGLDYAGFESGLTGTIGNYERISDTVADYMDDENNFNAYIRLITDGPLKIRFKKITQGREEEKQRFLREWKTYPSPNVLRKLLFYGSEEGDMSFKEDFITACYYYIHYDRLAFLRDALPKGARKKNDTISPIPFRPAGPEMQQTLPVFSNEPKCSLKFLKDTDEIDEARPTLEFRGETILLNRSNLEPDNYTITSMIQAEIKFLNGEWHIENKSRLKTTFLEIHSPVKIKKGDIIILGNKRFVFDE